VRDGTCQRMERRVCGAGFQRALARGAHETGKDRVDFRESAAERGQLGGRDLGSKIFHASILLRITIRAHRRVSAGRSNTNR